MDARGFIGLDVARHGQALIDAMTKEAAALLSIEDKSERTAKALELFGRWGGEVLREVEMNQRMGLGAPPFGRVIITEAVKGWAIVPPCLSPGSPPK